MCNVGYSCKYVTMAWLYYFTRNLTGTFHIINFCLNSGRSFRFDKLLQNLAIRFIIVLLLFYSVTFSNFILHSMNDFLRSCPLRRSLLRIDYTQLIGQIRALKGTSHHSAIDTYLSSARLRIVPNWVTIKTKEEMIKCLMLQLFKYFTCDDCAVWVQCVAATNGDDM